MPFVLTIETARDGQFNWFDLPDSDRPELERKRDEFNLAQVNMDHHLRIQGPNSLFDKPWSEIRSIKIED